MNDRPYRSGVQQKCVLCRQPTEIQETMIEMVSTNTYQEIADWLGTKNIQVTRNQVQYYIVKHGKHRRNYVIEPKKTHRERLIAYIDELLKYGGATYTIRILHMGGSSWSRISSNLHAAGLIMPVRQHTPIQWRIMGTKDEIRAWRDAEIVKIDEKDTTSPSDVLEIIK